jgi:hypothetical protein
MDFRPLDLRPSEFRPAVQRLAHLPSSALRPTPCALRPNLFI